MARAVGVGLSAVTMLIGGALWVAGVGISQPTNGPRSPNLAALEAFDQVASVLESPRCMNCHPRDNRPRQGDDRHVHLMNVQRGPANKGLPAMACSTCHQAHNSDGAGVPGAPHWQLAPKSMGWAGLTRGELCRTLLDRSKNGGRTPTALVKHMTGDALVRWAWIPGAGRTPPPLSMDELKGALEVWVNAGTPCPQ
jgi:hypothetical protein